MYTLAAGTPVSEEFSLRSKEACEEICLRGGGGSGTQGIGTPGQRPPTKYPAGGGALTSVLYLTRVPGGGGGGGGNTGGYVPSPSGNGGGGGSSGNGGTYSNLSAIKPTTSRPRPPPTGSGLPNGNPGGGNNGGYSGDGTPGGNGNNAGALMLIGACLKHSS